MNTDDIWDEVQRLPDLTEDQRIALNLPHYSQESEILVVGTLITAEGARFTPWTDGWCVGYRVEAPGKETQYIYFNPSSDTDLPLEDGALEQSNVFVYQGTTGDPAKDLSHHYYNIW